MPEAAAETYASRLADTLPAVRERMARAAQASGRAADAVRLVAVTKGHPLDALEAALAAGLTDLGENRVDELEAKVGALGTRAATWHFIGHIQSRKARRAAQLADLVHSVDTLRLASRLSQAGLEESLRVPVLVQVNTSGEATKSGFALDGAVERIHEVTELGGLRVDGLMTMAPLVADETVLARAFGSLRDVLERARRVTDRVGTELSMGMTNDLEIAIREGSTMVRIGTALFGERAQ
jgi:pyridoxal phosphate enzyme (YggS family)